MTPNRVGNPRQGFRTLDLASQGLGWTPSESSYFDSVNAVWNTLSSRFVIPRLLKRYNNKGAFERWSLVAIACYLGASQAWRPAGATKLRRALQYAIPAVRPPHAPLMMAWHGGPP